MFRKERGFTLIELLIVIAVIGVLAAAILPRYVSFSDDAAVGATKGALSSLRAALAIYVSKNDGYFPAPDSDGSNVISALVTGYIDFIPPEQVEYTSAKTYSAEKGDEDNAITNLAGADQGGGWVYAGGTTDARFYIDEEYPISGW